MQFEFSCAVGPLHWRVVPPVQFQVVILARIELHLVIRIIAPERIYLPTQVHRRKEGLLLRLVLLHLDRLVVVVQVVLLRSITSDQEITNLS